MKNERWTVEAKWNVGKSTWKKLTPVETFQTKAGAVRDMKQLSRSNNPNLLWRVVKL